jgi:hypothetical protein
MCARVSHLLASMMKVTPRITSAEREFVDDLVVLKRSVTCVQITSSLGVRSSLIARSPAQLPANHVLMTFGAPLYRIESQLVRYLRGALHQVLQLSCLRNLKMLHWDKLGILGGRVATQTNREDVLLLSVQTASYNRNLLGYRSFASTTTCL